MALDREYLKDLISRGEFAELFALVTLEEVAQAWCRYTARPHIAGVEEQDPDEWTILVVADIERLDESQARALLDLVIDLAPDDEVLEVVGALPLEEFLMDCDDDRLAWAEQRAGASARFRQALSHVHLDSAALPNLVERLERAAGVPLVRAEGTNVDFVPGDLPGTILMRLDTVVVQEFECDPSQVDATIKLWTDLHARS